MTDSPEFRRQQAEMKELRGFLENTMTEKKQSEALRLSHELRALHESKKYHPSGPGGQMCGSEQYRLVATGLAFEAMQNASIELLRQHALIEEMREACKKALYALKGREHDQFLRDAIAKAEAQS